jgi:hypothetical protein
MRILVSVIFIAAVIGCSKKASDRLEPTLPSTNHVASSITNQVLVLDEAKAIEIARQTAVASNKWASNIGHVRATRTDTGWRVLVVGGSGIIGQHCSITIDKEGKVTDYSPGM